LVFIHKKVGEGDRLMGRRMGRKRVATTIRRRENRAFKKRMTKASSVYVRLS